MSVVVSCHGLFLLQVTGDNVCCLTLLDFNNNGQYEASVVFVSLVVHEAHKLCLVVYIGCVWLCTEAVFGCVHTT